MTLHIEHFGVLVQTIPQEEGIVHVSQSVGQVPSDEQSFVGLVEQPTERRADAVKSKPPKRNFNDVIRLFYVLQGNRLQR
jgi:hypothetical protein